MNILFVAPRFHTNQFELVKSLISEGHKIDFHVSCVRNTENHSLITPKRFQESRISSILKKLKSRSINDFWYLPSFFAISKISNKIISSDLIVIRSFNRPQSILYLFLSVIFRKKIFLYTQGEISKLKSYENFFTRKIFYALNLFWFTPINNQDYKDNSTNSRIFFLPFVCEKKFYEEEFIIDRKNLNFLSIGKYEKRKNHELTIKTLRTFAIKKNIKISLTIVGQCFKKDEIKYFNKIKQSYKNTKNLKINFIKNIDHFNIQDLYKKNQFFILLSENEPAAYSPLEAISYGLITIGSNKNGTRSYIKESPLGFVSRLNQDALMNSIEKAYRKYTDAEYAKTISSKTSFSIWKKTIYRNTKLRF